MQAVMTTLSQESPEHPRDEEFVVRCVYRPADFYRCSAAANRSCVAGLLHSRQTGDES